MSELLSPVPEAELPVRDEFVWYVSYGSNLAAGRLRHYLEGGTPTGGARRNPGARDPRPPLRSMPVELPGALYFAGESPQWGGGVAFYDHTQPGPTAARAYLVTAGQFADIAAQEMHRMPRKDDPLEQVVVGGLGDAGRHEVGPGHYETLVEVGRHEDVAMLTFTAPHGRDSIDHSAPAPAYLQMLATGLAESHGWDDARTAAYFARVLPDDA